MGSQLGVKVKKGEPTAAKGDENIEPQKRAGIFQASLQGPAQRREKKKGRTKKPQIELTGESNQDGEVSSSRQ